MLNFWINSASIIDSIMIPKFYDPELHTMIADLSRVHQCVSLGELVASGELEVSTGHEIGSAAYGTGTIPFVRTSDISNWELKSSPKQGVAPYVYALFSSSQDVQAGDILFVRDGTYLIGTNCQLTSYDTQILFQSHILKFRFLKHSRIKPEEAFLLFNTPFVQKQIRSRQFTADIIDTLGGRWKDIVLPMPVGEKELLISDVREQLSIRVKGKCFIRQLGTMLESVLLSGNVDAFESFEALNDQELKKILVQDTVSEEYGEFEATWISSNSIKDQNYLPKYYDPAIDEELRKLRETCNLVTIAELCASGILSITTGHEPGKMAYGTGSVPFIRTSDFANWEIKHDPKQAVSEQIFEIYRAAQDLKANDILLVRDGTYLVGSSAMVLAEDERSLYCAGLYKLRAHEKLDPFLLFGLLNSYIVKRQIRAKQFTRDVIDTLGRRLFEVVVPLPKSENVSAAIARRIESVVMSRIVARDHLRKLASEMLIFPV